MICIRSTEGRILTLRTATPILVALLMDFVATFRKAYFMDAVLILSSLAFLGAPAAARYHGGRRSSGSIDDSPLGLVLTLALLLLTILPPGR